MSFCYYVLGVPNIHSVVWLHDDDGNLAPHFKENDEVSKANCEQFADSIIKGTRECDDEKVQELCQSLQHHCHSFTCYKKKKTRTIGEKCGHGRHDGEMTGPALKVQLVSSCFHALQ